MSKYQKMQALDRASKVRVLEEHGVNPDRDLPDERLDALLFYNAEEISDESIDEALEEQNAKA